MAVYETQKINPFKMAFRTLSDEEPEEGGVPVGDDLGLDQEPEEDLGGEEGGEFE